MQEISQEIQSSFNERPNLYFSKGYTYNHQRVPSTGKLIARLNYMRTFLQDVGALVPPKKETPLIDNEPKNIIGKINHNAPPIHNSSLHSLFENSTLENES